MKITEKKEDLLKLFGIPRGNDERALNVRRILSRLLAAQALRLAHLQTVRDIVERAGVEDAEAYLFVGALFVSENNGNAFMLADSVGELLAKSGHLGEEEAQAFGQSNDDFEKSTKAVCETLCKSVWLDKLKGDVLVEKDARWYFQRNYKAVSDLNETFPKFAVVQNLQEVSENIIKTSATFGAFSLNDAQGKALKAAVTQRFTVITGGPGTGKTTTVCAILRALLAMNPEWTEADIALVAPTGRAAQRMQDAILDQCSGLQHEERLLALSEKLEGSTVHRLLGGYAPNWKHDEKHPLDQKVVIVDETSMVDLYLMQALLKALKPDARLILLGDADQLPSVDTGAVLGDLTCLGADGGVVRKLETCERAKGEVYEVSHAINLAGKTTEAARQLIRGWTKIGNDEGALSSAPGKIPDGKSEFRWLEPGPGVKKTDILSLYSKWMSDNRLAELASGLPTDDRSLCGEKSAASQELFAELNRRRILTLVREGWYGVKEANAHLLKEAKAAAKRIYVDYLSLVGVPIMVTKNTPERKLLNGDVGVTVKGTHGMVVLFPRGQKTVVCPVALLPEHELAYAMTVHKSQGSEFEQVLVVLPDDEQHRLLSREIIYTGITRAKKRAVILGTEGALIAGLSRQCTRCTGIELK